MRTFNDIFTKNKHKSDKRASVVIKHLESQFSAWKKQDVENVADLQ